MDQTISSIDQDMDEKEVNQILTRVSELEISLAALLKSEKLGSGLTLDSREPNNKGGSSPPVGVVFGHVSDFFSCISLPGLTYVGESGRGWLERRFWTFLHVGALLISSVFILEEYKKWQNSPVVLSIKNTLTQVGDIPFPAVTVCYPERVRDDFDIQGLADACLVCDLITAMSDEGCYNPPVCNETVMQELSAAYILCGSSLVFNSYVFFKSYKNDNRTIVEEDQFDLSMKKIFAECDDRYLQINSLVPLNCEVVSTMLMRSHSTPVCFTYNSLPAHDIFKNDVVYPIVDKRTNRFKNSTHLWNTDTMVKYADNDFSVPVYYERQFGVHLSIKKRPYNQTDTCMNIQDIRSRIYLHHPGEIPSEENTRSYSFRPNRAIFIYLKPAMTSSEYSLSKYPPSRRHCYFAEEKKLSLFKMYTQKNCHMECRSNCTIAHCGCVSYYLPRQNRSVRVCSHEKEDLCISQVEPVLQSRVSKLTEFQRPECVCDCLPDCNSLSYNFELEDEENLKGPRNDDETTITMIYENDEFSTFIRYEINTIGGFIAFGAGFLGMFNGFTFMVVWEILYFLTIRLWGSIKASLPEKKG